jgi:hypothetical protein
MRVKQHSKQDLAMALHPKYLKANRMRKGRLLDEFVEVTGYHRNYAKRILLHGYGSTTPTGRVDPRTGTRRHAGGRPTLYKPTLIQALCVTAEATGWICGKRLVGILPELVSALEEEGALCLFAQERAALLNMSAATIDRKLARERARHKPKGVCTTKPGTLLRSQIPIRTYTPWDEQQPGFLEIDLVAHCGQSTVGTYLCTLNCVDVATGWTECVAVANKGQGAVFGALQLVRERLPFPMLGIDSDNGSEFINDHLVRYCQGEQITFTRCRPYRKNDQAHVEQKNGSVVRQLVGYDRYTTPLAVWQLDRVYELVRLYVNAYLPVMKLVSKQREGAKIHKRYDVPTPPYKRALHAGVLTPKAQAHFQAQLKQAALGPLSLRHRLLSELDKLWTFSATASYEATIAL